ncbi:MAG: TonB-dependent receptor [Gammaproteobacteria bacterium]|nr:TonB-dependent receptor [Gammaproteobacteria bacterium]
MKEPMYNKHLLSAITLLLSQNAFSNEHVDDFEDYLMDEMPIVLSATRLAQPKSEAPAAMTIIDRRMIESSGAIEIAELFRLVPGFQVAYASGANTGYTMTVTYHGFSGERSSRTQVLIDGRSAYSAADGTVDWFNLPITIDDIERIEIVRGPNGATFGANAFIGTINIITKDPNEYSGTDYIATYGNKGIREGTIRNHYQSEKLNLRITARRSMDTGFDNTRFLKNRNNPASGYETFIANDQKRTTLINTRGDYEININNKIDFGISYVEGYRAQGANGDANYIPNDMIALPHDSNTIFQHEHIRWTHTRGDEEEISVQFFHSYNNRKEIAYDVFANSGNPGYIAAFGSDAMLDYGKKEQRYEVELQHSKRINEDYRLIWGTSARLDRVSSPTWFDRTSDIRTYLYRIYTNQEWHASDKILINAGIMLEHSSLSGTETAPRLAINYAVTPNHNIRLGASRAVRLPNIYEAYAAVQPQTYNGIIITQFQKSTGNIRTEKVSSIELGYLWNQPSIHTELDVRIFRDKITDYIKQGVKDKGPAATWESYIMNSPGIIIKGIEFSLNYKPSRYSLINLNHAYLNARGASIDRFTDINDPATYAYETGDYRNVPTQTTSLFVSHRLANQWDVSAIYYRVSNMRWQGNGDDIPGQDRLDLRISKKFKLAGNDTSVAITAQNILGEYVGFADGFIMDTKVLLNLKLHLN